MKVELAKTVAKAAATGLAVGVGATSMSAIAFSASAAGLVVFSTGFIINAVSIPLFPVLFAGEALVKELKK